MRISAAWLSEWVDAGLDPSRLAARLTMSGLEVESIEPAAGDFQGVVVGEVLAVERAPGRRQADTSARSTAGGATLLQVVCGAPNVRAGMKAPLAFEGARLAAGEVIGQAKLRGVDSNGMLCSARDLGLSDDARGFLELPDELADGHAAARCLALDDTILDSQADAKPRRRASVLGIARDVAAIFARKLNRHARARWRRPARAGSPVQLEAPAYCPRFSGRVVQGVNPAARTPLWMRRAARARRTAPHRPVVDITNYVMLELGQPLHAFDLAHG